MKSISTGWIISLIASFYTLLISCNDHSPTQLDLDIPSYLTESEEILDSNNPTTIEGVELGRFLFYDKLVSRDNSMSCASCHIQALAFTDGKTRAIGIYGNELLFNSMTLTNVLFSNKLFWDGRGKSLEKQALAPVVNHLEMDQRLSITVRKLENTDLYPRLFQEAFGSTQITPKKIAYSLAQFERTLISFNSKYDQYLNDKAEFSELEKQGMDLFFTTPKPAAGIRGAGCVNCHVSGTFAGSSKNFDGFKNNGLNRVHYSQQQQGLQRLSHNSNDYGKFKVPTLRNVGVTSPYMHDGRFNSLDEVLGHYSDGINFSKSLDTLLMNMTNDTTSMDNGLILTSYEKKSIIAFLNTLTDEEFLNNSRFSSPFR